ncbi:MAG TPA: PH domain-containing protein [Longimicrobiales bacterium]|nr:PH domain-containing protein [Longimicrobiales bacterium]
MPLDRGLIDQQLQELGEGSRWWDVRELRDLPAVLHADERILAIARGKIARVRWLRRRWLILVTNRRLLCIRSGTTGWRQLEVPAGQITRVTLRIGPLRGRVLVVAGGRKYRLLAPRVDAHKLLSALSLLNTSANRAVTGFGPTRMVRQVIDHMLALPAVALAPEPRAILPAPAPDTTRLEDRLDSLEEQVQELRDQIGFLEQLLRERHAASGATESA